MKVASKIPQLYLRLALGMGFIVPVANRIGWLGSAGYNGVSWGNWGNFAAYTNTLLPFLNLSIASIMGLPATIAEISISVFLTIGYKTRLAAFGGFALTLIFTLSVAFFFGIKSPFTHSVFSDSAGSLLLASIPVYNWSLDKLCCKKKSIVSFFFNISIL